jgi:hypothetical protein
MSRWLVLENCAFVLVPWNLIIILICRLDGVHEQIGHLHRLIHGPLSKDFDYLLSAQNLKKAEVEVDLLGDEVDNLVALLERVSTVLEHYSPVLQHYPGVKEVAETIKSELSERTGDPIVQ